MVAWLGLAQGPFCGFLLAKASHKPFWAECTLHEGKDWKQFCLVALCPQEMSFRDPLCQWPRRTSRSRLAFICSNADKGIGTEPTVPGTHITFRNGKWRPTLPCLLTSSLIPREVGVFASSPSGLIRTRVTERRWGGSWGFFGDSMEG